MMKQKVKFGLGNRLYRENDVDALIPELWAREGLSILTNNLIATNLVYRDFENVLQEYGDTVNVHRPAEFTAKRKIDSDSVTIQDANVTNIPVVLNQHWHVSILLKDGQESKSFVSLVELFLKPQIIAIAQAMDLLVCCQYAQFMSNVSGFLNGLTASNAQDEILNLRQKFNTNKAPMDPRNFILNPVTDTTLLKVQTFVQAQQVGDQGQALAKANLGQKYGFWFYMDQNMPYVATGNTTLAGALTADYPVGTTSIVVDGFTGTVTTGNQWVTIDGDATPQRVVSKTDTLGNLTALVITPGLRHAALNNAVVTAYTPGAVNFSAGYAAGWVKEITVNGFTVAPQVGQMVSFGLASTNNVYTIMDVNGLVGITLDRPLVVAIANTDKVNIGPAGSYNLALHPNALALVTRPLATPNAKTGALSSVVEYNGISIRVVITYSGEKQGHLVTADILAGIATLDTRLGGVMLA